MERKTKPEIEAIYPLSPMQQGMLFHTLQHPDEPLYFEQLHCTIVGALNLPAFTRAWQSVVDRHAILRTSFVWKKLDKLLQVVHKQVQLPVLYQDWRALSAREQTLRLQAFLREDKKKGFNLVQAPLIRLAFFQIADDRHLHVWSNHHILLDGWSLPLLMTELIAHYEAYLRGEAPVLPAVRPYRDYINWLQQQDMAKAERFWKEKLGDFSEPVPVVVQRSTPITPTSDGGYLKEECHLSPEATVALQNFAQQNRLTLNTLVQGAWALLLSKYSGMQDILFGSTVSGRPHDLLGSDKMLGLFINTLPTRIQVTGESKLIPWLQSIQSSQYETREYEYTPLFEIQGWTRVPRTEPLFKSLLVFENYPVDQALGGPEGRLRFEEMVTFERTNYPLTVSASPGKQFYLAIAYQESLFDREAIGRMLRHLNNLLNAFVAQPEHKLSQYRLLTEPEYRQIADIWSQSPRIDVPETTVDKLFARQADENPEAAALVFRDQTLTYSELNSRANQLARYLKRLGVKAETIVAVSLDRSIEMIVAIMGILKAGGAYLPIDPANPSGRISHILKDCGTALVLTSAKYRDLLAFPGVQSVCLDTEWSNVAAENTRDTFYHSSADNLAYVIYTSGSTGQPKGVMIAHRGLISFVDWFINHIKINQQDRVLQFASFSFDASVIDIFSTLLRGATLVLTPKETIPEEEKLLALIREERISILAMSPAMLQQLPGEDFPDIKTVVSGGEVCTWATALKWSARHRFYNAYGPTEITIGCTAYRVEGKVDDSRTVPIGKPIQNSQVYVLDSSLQPAPVGVPGELYVGGIGVGRGYLNRPDLTAEKYIPNPFGRTPGERLYRTGDLTRLLPDGNIEFLGRIDHQIKIRGFRIETGEIEYVLSQYAGIEKVIVLAREDGRGEKQLTAYLLKLPEASHIDQGLLREFARKRVPEYMVPVHFIELEHLPLTSHGKVDVKALPAPDHSAVEDGQYVAPRTQVEELLATIWAGILGVEKISSTANFFDLGGHSLMATRAISRIREIFQVELPIQMFFEAASLTDLADKISRAQSQTGDSDAEMDQIEPVARESVMPLSFAQQRLWFLDQLEPGNPFYTIPAAVRLSGKLDVTALKKSLTEIIQRHEILRTRFDSHNGMPVQIIDDTITVELKIVDLNAIPGAEREGRLHQIIRDQVDQPFDLTSSPLLRFLLIELQPDEHILVFTIHHIIADGWSIGLLIQEFTSHYRAFAESRSADLAALPIQYADFAAWQKSSLHAPLLEKELDYWREQLKESPPLLDLPLDHPRPSRMTFNGATEETVFSGELVREIHRMSRDSGVTPFMILLAAYQYLLSRYSGQDDILVGSAIANRNHREIENLIGFFVNTLVFRTRIKGTDTFADLLKQVRQTSLGAYAHQDVPFELVVEALNPVRDMSHSPLFQAAFVFQNAPAQSLELPELKIETIELASHSAKFDLTMTMAEKEGQLCGYLEYNSDLFAASTIKRMLHHLQILLSVVLKEPAKQLDEISLLDDNESEMILHRWNETASPYPSGKSLDECFTAVAVRNPDAVAVRFNGLEINYGELNRRANKLAHALIRGGLGREQLVGISMLRSVEMVVAMLAVAKAGGAFVPIDPNHPPERLVYLIEDSGIVMLLTQEALAARFAEHTCRIMAVDHEWPAIETNPDSAPLVAMSPENLAYVIYTSGSTGKPKGTLLSHRGLINLANAQQKAFNISPDSRILQFSSLSFDASIWETVMALLNGATLCLADQQILASGQELVALLEREAITVLTLPPSVIAVMPYKTLPSLHTLITAGEKCPGDLVEKWSIGRQFVNAYGPTETTVCASIYECAEGFHQSPPIGRPIDNTRLYVLDRQLRPVPIGVPGELYISGIGLARGYLHRPELTAIKFVPDPFAHDPGARMYATGDLVRYLQDGNIEYIGRIDHQIKLRGFRIELGEIESFLKDHPDVVDAVVMLREDRPGDRRLVAYLVGKNGTTVPEIKRYLKERVPEYMVPASILFLDAMPLNTSGKIDRKQLPVPDQGRSDLAVEYVAPRNREEEEIAAMVAELLGLAQVGIHDSFFELGGHSLLATQFVSKLRDTYHVELPLRILFEKPTVAELAQVVQVLKNGNGNNGNDTIGKVERSESSIEDLLAEINQLTDEEAMARLNN